MSIQWTLVAGLLYTEISFVIILLLPFIKPRTWQKIFKSRLLRAFERNSQLYFTGFIIILFLLFLDAIRESHKYQRDALEINPGEANLGAENQLRMKLFRAQRNFYISGFALFLWMVIKRIINLISFQAQLEASTEASMKQAISASEAVKSMMDKVHNDTEQENGSDDFEKLESEEMKKIKLELTTTQEELARTNKSMEALKLQAQSVDKEYDRLISEHKKLQEKSEQPIDKKND